MAQYVGDISNVLQTAQAIGQQLAQSQQTGIEQARVNAANYLQNLRNDAEKAGYSVAQWAKMNETGVKNALFHLSGMNQDVTEQKYQELLNGPTSGDQRLQEYKDQFLKENDPGSLFGTEAQYGTRTVSKEVPVKTPNQGINGQVISSALIPSTDIFKGIKESKATNPIDYGLELYNREATKLGKPTYKTFKEWEENDKASYNEWVNYRKGLLKDYGIWTDEDYKNKNKSISVEDNKKLWAAMHSPPQVIARRTEHNLVEGIPEGVETKLKQSGILRTTGDYSSNGRPYGLSPSEANPETVQRIVDAYKESGDPKSLEALRGWSFEELKPYLKESSDKPYTESFYIDRSLPDLEFFRSSSTAEPTTKTVKEEEKYLVDPGKPGYIDLLNSMNEKLLDAGSLGDTELYKLKQDQEKLQASINESKTSSERNKASAQLMQVQTMQLLNAAKNIPGVPQERIDDFNKKLLQFYKDFPAEKIDDILSNPTSKAAYDARMASLKNLATDIGFGMDFNRVIKESWLPFGIGDKDLGQYPIVNPQGSFGGNSVTAGADEAVRSR